MDDAPQEPSPAESRFTANADHASASMLNAWPSILLAAAGVLSLLAFVGLLALPWLHPRRPVATEAGRASYSAPDISPPLTPTAASSTPENSDRTNSPIVGFRDRRDAERFLVRLRKSSDDPLVVSLALQSASTAEQGYLLLGDARGAELLPSGTVSISELLQAIHASPAQHKLLVLETTYSAHALEQGMLGNDFSYHLRREFAALSARVVDGTKADEASFAVLGSCDAGQTTFTSPSLPESPFTLAVSYGLQGGDEADRALNGLSVGDGTIMVSELAEFVQRTVGRWSLDQRDALQSPVYLLRGTDFEITPVTSGVTWHGSTPAASSRQAGSANQEESPSPGAGSATTDSQPDGDGGDNSQDSSTNATAQRKPAESPATKSKTAQPAKDAKTPASAAGAKHASDAAGAADAADAGDATHAGVASKTDATKETNELLERLNAFWRQREQLSAQSQVLWMPDVWAAFQQTLIQAEGELLAGDTRGCRRLLDGEAQQMLRILEEPLPAFPIEVWSLADVSDATANVWLDDERKAIETALAVPSAKNLSALANSRTVEGQLLSFLGDFDVANDRWRDADLVRRAIATQTLAHQAANSQSLAASVLLEPSVRAGDAAFRNALASFYRRAPAALIREQVDLAESAYRHAVEQRGTLEQAASQVEAFALEAPFYLDWLAASPGWGAAKTETMLLLNRSFGKVAEVAALPDSRGLTDLQRTVRQLQQRAAYEAEIAVRGGNWQGMTAALRWPALKPALRATLLEKLVSRAEPVSPHARPVRGRPIPDWPANPYTLTGWTSMFQRLGGRPDLPVSLRQGLAKFDPARVENRLMLADVLGDPVVLRERSMATDQLRAYLGELRKLPAANDLQEVATWRYRTQRLAAAYWRSRSMSPDAQRAEASRGWRRQGQLRVVDELKRLAYIDRFLPAEVYQRTLTSTQRSRDIAMNERLFETPTVFRLDGPAPIQLTVGDRAGRSLEVRVGNDVPRGVRGRLILEWNPQSKIDVSIGSDSSAEGQLAVDLPSVIAGRAYRLPLTIETPKNSDSAVPLNFTARVEWSRKSNAATPFAIDWLSLDVVRIQATPPRAQLVVSWPNDGADPRGIDLFPNQVLPVTVSVQRLVSEPLQLELRLEGRATPLAVVELKDDKLTPIKPAPGTSLPLNAHRLVFQLFERDNKLDEQIVELTSLDLDLGTRREVRFDPRRREVTVDVEQLVVSDSSADLPFSVGLDGATNPQGRLSLSLSPAQSRGQMDLHIDRDAALPYQITVGACGLADLFCFRLRPNQLVAERDDQLRLRVAAPALYATFPSSPNAAQLTVDIQAGGPRRSVYRLGIDGNSNNSLEPAELLASEALWFGRVVNWRLDTTKAPPGFEVHNTLDNASTVVDVTGWNGRQDLIAEAESSSHVCRQPWPIFFLAGTPSPQIVSPGVGEAFPVGATVPITLQADRRLVDAIDELQVGFDLNADGKLEAKEIAASVPRPQAGACAAGDTSPSGWFDETGRVEVAIVADKLALGPVTVLAQAVTNFLPLEAAAKPTTMASSVASQTINIDDRGTIAGRVVTADGLSSAGALVEVVGVARQLTGDDGGFHFAQLPPGKYTLQAATAARFAVNEVALAPGGTSVVRMELRLK